MATTINDGENRIMNDHGVYPLLDTLTNDALLSAAFRDDRKTEQVNLYVDAKGLHLVWRTVKRDRDGDAIWNGGTLLMETKSKDVTAEFAAKLDYDGEAPDLNSTAKASDDDPQVTPAEWMESYDGGFAFAISGLHTSNGIHVDHVFATNGKRSALVLANGVDRRVMSHEHMQLSHIFETMTPKEIQQAPTESDILSTAKELLK